MKIFWTLFLLAISARNAAQQAIPTLALKGSALAFGYDPSVDHETPFFPGTLRNDSFVVPNVNLTALSNFTIEYWGFTQGTLTCIWDYTTYSQAAVFSGTMSNYFALVANFGNYSDPGTCAKPYGGSIVGSTGGSITTYSGDQTWCHVSTSIRPSSLGLSHVTSQCIGGFNNTRTFSAPALNINANSLMVGKGLMSNANAVFGELDELRIWNVYKTPEQIAETRYLSIPVDEPNLFAYYRMDDQNFGNPTSTADYTAGGRTATFSPQRPHYTKQYWQGPQMGVTPLRIVKRRINYNGVLTIPMWYTSYTTGTQAANGEFISRPSTFTIGVNSQTLDSTALTFSLGTEVAGTGVDFNLTFTPTRSSCGTQQSGSLQVNLPGNNPPITGSVSFDITTLPLSADPSSTEIPAISTTGGTVTITGTNFGLNGNFGDTESIQFQFADKEMNCTNPIVSNGGTQIQCQLGAWVGAASVVFNMCQQTSTMPNYFTYLAPVVTSVAAANQSTVAINGENFGPSRPIVGDSIEVDGQPCVINSITHTQIFCSVGFNLTDSEHSLNMTIGGQRIIVEFNFTLCVTPCKNGGECIGADTCECPLGFDGQFCQIELKCTPECKNGGKCVKQENGGNVCDCSTATDGYFGVDCTERENKTNIPLIAGTAGGAGGLIIILIIVVAVLVARRKPTRGTSNFVPLHKKDFSKIIYGEQLTQQPDKVPGADLRRLEELLIQDNLDLAFTISKITQITEADKIAKAMVVVFQDNNKSLPLLEAFVNEEVRTSEQAGTLFRSNSMVSKMFKFYSRLIGLPYLYITIGPEMDELIAEELGLEVDPEKMEEGTDLDEMRWTLMAQSQKILKTVLNSIEDCPPQFRQLFAHIKVAVAERFPDNVNTTIGGFIFLRFFCPAVSAPEAYGIVEEPPSASARRLLILITKVLQNLSNDVEFGSKEPYMTKMNDFIQSNRVKLAQFFDKLVKPPTKPPVTVELPRNMKPLSIAILAQHLKDNMNKIDNADLRKQLQSILE
eukprot:TRINITY_DN1412_c0_g2_i5.p1 TRINITY_DN1412_c0_g2~~TRINITY_DN1412_c0_g2_i5.p1  ORF type:complete len:1014 (-),score=174.59 TRINITY_DN1412_c0_g2_i5:78-3119(-)